MLGDFRYGRPYAGIGWAARRGIARIRSTRAPSRSGGHNCANPTGKARRASAAQGRDAHITKRRDAGSHRFTGRERTRRIGEEILDRFFGRGVENFAERALIGFAPPVYATAEQAVRKRFVFSFLTLQQVRFITLAR